LRPGFAISWMLKTPSSALNGFGAARNCTRWHFALPKA
jgi:hypothetical protein